MTDVKNEAAFAASDLVHRCIERRRHHPLSTRLRSQSPLIEKARRTGIARHIDQEHCVAKRLVAVRV
jgi:hypothetical protein